MNHRDNSLRPPLEFLPVAGCVAILLCLVAGWPSDGLQLGLVWPIAVGAILLLVARLCQAVLLMCYRSGLKHNHSYRVSQIPLSRQRLFLGKGFAWHRLHRQRLHEVREIDLATSDAVGDAALHGVGLRRESKVWMNLSDRTGHTLVVGTTRVGKTRLAEMLIAQDIMRGECVIVLDPKGDIELLRRMASTAVQAGRCQHFHIFHLGFPKSSDAYNPVGEFGHVTEVATRIARQLPSGGNSAAFREFAWRFTNIVAQALVALGRCPDLQLVAQSITNIEGLFLEYGKYYLRQNGMVLPKGKGGSSIGRSGKHPKAVELANYLRDSNVTDPVLLGLISAFNYDKSYFDKVTASLLPLLEKMTTGEIGNLLIPSPDATAAGRVLRWRQVISGGGIAYVGLDALSDPEVAAAVGNSMLADLTSVAGEIYKHGIGSYGDDGRKKMPSICLHVDEFNELAKEEFIPLLNKSGGAGMQVTAYTQTASDMEAAVGDLARAEQMRGNMNTLIMLRVKNRETAELLTSKLQQVQVYTRVPDSSAGDGDSIGLLPEFSSRSGDRLVPIETGLLEPEDLMSLPKGHAFVLLSSGRLYKVKLPLLAEVNDVANGIDAIVAQVRSQNA